MHSRLHVLLLPALALLAGAPGAPAKDPLVFVTSFAPARAEGKGGAIQAYQLDLASGAMKARHRTPGVENPFFLALSPDRRFLYSIHAKQFGGKDAEEVAAFEVEGPAGKLKPLNRQSALGSAACYLDVASGGRTVLVANYLTGSVAALPAREDGSLGKAEVFLQHAGKSVDPARQKGPHAHCITLSPDGKFAYAADLGLDQILCYKVGAEKPQLAPARQPFVRTPPGAGPRHLTFHPNGKHAYVINELANSVTLFDHDAGSGFLVERQTIPTLPKDFTGKSYCADVKVTPNGRFLYGTNRGHDSIAAYKVAADGTLTLIGIEPSLGKGPQNLAITPDGKWLLCANMPGNNLAVFSIGGDGVLKSAGTPIEHESPSCIRIVP